jgi:hypothetical protein
MTDRVTDLLTDYRDQAPTAFRVPDLSELESGPWRLRQRRRRRQRLAVGMSVPVAAALVLVVAMSLFRGNPTPEPPVPTADSIYTVDWTRTELTLPHDPQNHCPEGKVRLRPGTFPVSGSTEVRRVGVSGEAPAIAIVEAPTVYGDLTRDGQPEVVLAIRCGGLYPGASIGQMGAQLLAVTMRPDHSLVGLQFVGTPSAQYPSFHVDGGLLYVQMRYNHASANGYGGTAQDTAFTQVFRWDGRSFVKIAGRDNPLNFTGAHDGYGVVSQLADILSSDGHVLCPAALVPFAYAPFEAKGFSYGDERQRAQPVDVDGDGNEEIVVAVRCSGPGYHAVSLYVFTQGTDRFLTLDVPLANDGRYTLESFEATTAALTIVVTTPTEGRQVRVLFWDGTRYQPSYGAYRR